MTSVWKIGDIGRPSIAILIALIAFLLPRTAIAGHGEEANAVIDRWSAAYSANDPDAITKNYRPDAILLGTVSPVISQGSQAIRAYFSAVKDSGNKNTIGERHTIVLDDNAVLVTGFYEFTRMKGGEQVPAIPFHHASDQRSG